MKVLARSSTVVEASRAIGVRIALSTTMKRLMPSMPSVYRTPRSADHEWSVTNW